MWLCVQQNYFCAPSGGAPSAGSARELKGMNIWLARKVIQHNFSSLSLSHSVITLLSSIQAWRRQRRAAAGILGPWWWIINCLLANIDFLPSHSTPCARPLWAAVLVHAAYYIHMLREVGVCVCGFEPISHYTARRPAVQILLSPCALTMESVEIRTCILLTLLQWKVFAIKHKPGI